MLSGMETIYNALSDAWVYVAQPNEWSGRYLLPVPTDKTINLVRRDTATGWIYTAQEIPLIGAGAGDLIDLGTIGEPEGGAPRLVGASPFDLISFTKPDEGESSPLRLEIEAHHSSGAGQLELRQTSEDFDPHLPFTA
jgi:hypothetical protein